MDYKDFEPGSQAASARGDVGYWWKEEDAAERGQYLVAAAQKLRDDDQTNQRSQSNLRHAALYGNFEAASFNVRDYTRQSSLPQNKISLNVVVSCVDTLAAKVSKTRPRPMFTTSGASFRKQRAARLLDKFVRGLFYEAQFHEVAKDVFMDGCIFDAGAMKVYLDANGKIVFERTFPEELFLDAADARYGAPRQLFQRKLIAKEVLCAEYADDAKALEAILATKPPADAYDRGFGDCVEVWEGWHLRSSKQTKDGHHVIAVQGGELFHEEWKFDFFPFAFFRFSKRQLGFWGQGLAERLTGIQVEINRLIRSISEQLRRRGRGRVYLPIDSKIPKDQLRNAIGDIVEFAGPNPPVIDNANAVAAEEFAQLDRLYERAFQEAGISELSAGAKKPSGLDAAVALREFNDIESERFALVGQSWENLPLLATKIAVQLIDANRKAYRVGAPGRRHVEWVDWKEIDLKADEYVIQMFPVSSLPLTPSHRYQRVKEMRADGFIDQATAERLIDMPDIEAETKLALAAYDDVDATIGAILDFDEPRFVAPDEFTNLPLLVERASAAYLRAKHQEDIEPNRISMLIDLIDQASAILSPPQAAVGAPPAMPGSGMQVPAAPMMAPPGGAGDVSLTGGGDISVGPPPPTAVQPLIQQ